jgi:flagellar motor switch/type III secretory pathway protein FliN
MSAAGVSPAVTEKTAAQLEDDARWLPLQALPCLLTVELALTRFTVRDFLALRAGSIVGSHWGLERDVPLQVNGTFIGWGELEGAGARLAVRVTDLA